MAEPTLTVDELTSPGAIATSFDLMKTLRDRIVRDTYVSEVERQRSGGYRLFAGKLGDRLVTLAGVRHTYTLARGDHVFVDDLIVHGDERARGIGRQMMSWLADWTTRQGAPMLYLDSRDTAKGFYQALGFKFLTSLPCFIPPESLRRI